MRVLVDQGTPVPLRAYLRGCQVVTVFEAGWSRLSNGELLRRAQQQFDVFVTTDKQLRNQQNLSPQGIAILVLPYANWPKLELDADRIAEIVRKLQPGEYVELSRSDIV